MLTRLILCYSLAGHNLSLFYLRVFSVWFGRDDRLSKLASPRKYMSRRVQMWATMLKMKRESKRRVDSIVLAVTLTWVYKSMRDAASAYKRVISPPIRGVITG